MGAYQTIIFNSKILLLKFKNSIPTYSDVVPPALAVSFNRPPEQAQKIPTHMGVYDLICKAQGARSLSSGLLGVLVRSAGGDLHGRRAFGGSACARA